MYGSVWGTAGTGSVLLLDGKARGLAGPMAGVRAVQRAFGWLFTGRAGFPWPYGGWDLPWLLHVPEVRPWETGPAGTWGNRVDNTGGYRDDDWLAESFGRLLRTMAGGSVCPDALGDADPVRRGVRVPAPRSSGGPEFVAELTARGRK